MLIIENLTIRYNIVPVFERLNIRMETNCIHGIIGLNGSGKTTLFHAIFGLIKPDLGNIIWIDQPLQKKDIALLETQNYFYSGITGREYLKLFKLHNSSFNIEVWQDLFRLPLDELIENYSTGMKKKLALTGILILDKPIVLLDEPFNGIDLETSRIIRLLLERLKEKGKTIIISSHILETLTNSCDYIHVIESKGIKKTYQKNEWKEMEWELFGAIDEQIKNKMEGML